MISNTQIGQWLLANQPEMKLLCETLSKEYSDLLKTENSAFHEVIKQEFEHYIKEKIMTECGKAIALSPMEIMIELEGLDIWEYLNG